ncbi:MAG: hypothetical protein KME06_07090 [Kastovskya adunca ATA6-11-RM4]|jgi:hypothetical protein|nr:hypothetical protein [Kastovskya adunca ATA6-11-RM4]
MEMQSVNVELPNLTPDYEAFGLATTPLSTQGTVLAQAIEDPDVLGQMQDAFNNFIESGQVWALLIGLVLGYMLRNLTAS